MKIKSNKEVSFGSIVDSGATKEEIMRLKGMSSKEYEKALESLNKLRESAAKGELPAQQRKKYRRTGASDQWTQ